MSRLLKLIMLTVSLTACTSQQETSPNQAAAITYCPEQRPQICTMDYRPVCATRDTGIRCVTTPCPSTEQKTYSNACSACVDIKVIGHIPDECPASPTTQQKQQ